MDLSLIVLKRIVRAFIILILLMDGGGDATRDITDLNSDPGSSGSLISNLGRARDEIEVRIRRLEEVNSRLRQHRARFLESQSRVAEGSDVVAVAIENTALRGNENEGSSGESGAASGNFERGCKRDSSRLVAKALAEMEEDKKEDDEGGSLYDCNICLEVAKEPVLTCCGHLFCWPCFYQLEYVDLTAKQCPVCRGDVVESNLTPIYGSVNSSHVPDSGSGVCIPPRPRANRVESTRQRVRRPATNVPVAEAIRRIRMGIGATTEQLRRYNQATSEQPRRLRMIHSTDTDMDLPPWPLWVTEEDWPIEETESALRNQATLEQPGQQNLSIPNAGSVTERQPLRRDAEIGGSQHNNAISPQVTEQSLHTGNAGLVTDMQPLSRIAEIEGRRHDDATTEQLGPQNLVRETTGFVTGLEPFSRDAGTRRRSRAHIQRVLSETDASLSSVSFALNSSERLVENIETFIRVLNLQRTHSQLSEARNLLSSSVAVTQTEVQSLNSTAEPSLARVGSAPVAPSENPETVSSVSELLSIPPGFYPPGSFPSTGSDSDSEHLSIPPGFLPPGGLSSIVSDTESDIPRPSRRRRLT